MKTKKIIILALTLMVLSSLITFLALRKNDSSSYDFVTPQIGNIQEEVKSSGLVKAADDVNLVFERSGKIAQINVKVGDKVIAGQVLASLSSADLAAQLAQARAAYDAQLVKLQELKNGARSEDLNVSQTQVDSANKSLIDAQSNLDNVKTKAALDVSNLYGKSQDALNDAYAKAFDAVDIKVINLFSNPNSDSPQFIVPISTSQTATSDLSWQIIPAQKDLDDFKNQIDNLGSEPAAIDMALADNLKRLDNTKSFLKKISLALNDAIVSGNFSQATINAYKSSTNAALSEVNVAAGAINSQIQALASQKTLNTNLITQATNQVNAANNGLTLATSQLNLKKAGASKEQLGAQQAYVDQAQASVDSAAAQLAKAVLVSPINGTVSAQNGHAGELTPSALPIVSLLSDAKFQIDTQVAEKDIAKIKIGQTANVVLDAYGNGQEFPLTVIAIDPASTLVDGSSVYKVTLEFNAQGAEIKQGLTANIKFLTNNQQNVLTIPASALVKDGLKTYVIVDNKTAAGEKRAVEVGISSSDGLVEIKSGLNQSDRVAIFGN